MQSRAQSSVDLSGKNVAIYFSKKGFSFSDDHRFTLSEFIKSERGLETPMEDLRQQSLVSLGRFLSSGMNDAIQTDSAFFLNENPKLASGFINSYNADGASLDPQPELFSGVDYVISISQLMLGATYRTVVFVRSNKMITEKEVIFTARLNMELWDPATGKLVGRYTYCFDEKENPVSSLIFDMNATTSREGEFFSRMFTYAFLRLLSGESNTCGE